MTQNRVVIVTGGSRGLGLGIVQSLLEAGYGVATCSREPSDPLRAVLDSPSGSENLYWRSCRVGVESEEEGFFRDVQAWLDGRTLYGLVNNAGVAGEGILATFPNVDSERIIQVNLLGALRLSRLTLRALLTARTPGRIINISSIIGSRGYTGLAAYSASKAGMDGLTRSLAREVGPRGITVNSIAPGYLETEMSAGLGESQRRQIERRTPLGRLGSIADVVPLVGFLLSDAAGYITGQTIMVDGGISC